jgi:hypothetical protein
VKTNAMQQLDEKVPEMPQPFSTGLVVQVLHPSLRQTAFGDRALKGNTKQTWTEIDI